MVKLQTSKTVRLLDKRSSSASTKMAGVAAKAGKNGDIKTNQYWHDINSQIYVEKNMTLI